MEIIQEISKCDICCHVKTFNKKASAFHWHDKYEICQVIKNDFSIRVDGEVINTSVGDIIAINEHVVHQFIVGADDTRIRIFQFPIKILLGFGNLTEPLKTHIKAEEIAAVNGLEEQLNALFSIMENDKAADPNRYDSFLQSTAASVYFLLERHFAESQNAFTHSRDSREFHKIIAYINNHFKEDVTVESAAANLFLARGRLSSIFKKYAGISINDYLNTLRVKNANLLLSNGKNVTEAALESGFQSIRTFNSVYRKSLENMEDNKG